MIVYVRLYLYKSILRRLNKCLVYHTNYNLSEKIIKYKYPRL